MPRAALLKYAAWCSCLLFSPHATGSDATGTVRYYSCSQFRSYHLDLTRFKGRTQEKSIVFIIPGGGVLEQIVHEKKWTAAEAMACAGPWPGVCESFVDSKIQTLRVTHRWKRYREVSGNFAVEFQDGRKLKGSFTAKFKLPRKPYSCE